MTEEEAKTKWCPAIRFTPSTEAHHPFSNRGASFLTHDTQDRCIASACMAWRATDNVADPATRQPSDASPIIYKPAGYCGLAGAPQ